MERCMLVCGVYACVHKGIKQAGLLLLLLPSGSSPGPHSEHTEHWTNLVLTKLDWTGLGWREIKWANPNWTGLAGMEWTVDRTGMDRGLARLDGTRLDSGLAYTGACSRIGHTINTVLGLVRDSSYKLVAGSMNTSSVN
eukprot:scaffold71494_cov20-Prasinocladus_malaysianus.AAC.1